MEQILLHSPQKEPVLGHLDFGPLAYRFVRQISVAMATSLWYSMVALANECNLKYFLLLGLITHDLITLLDCLIFIFSLKIFLID